MNDLEQHQTLPGSIGRYMPGECTACEVEGRLHYILVCIDCGAPPAGDGKCLCDHWWGLGDE